tara:strand:- start:3111 stop:3767 length:657 start_codon:yes stop_codon:yes gene_type:complete
MVYRHVVNQVIIEMDKIRSDGRYLKEFMKEAKGSNLFDKLANYKSGDKKLNPMMNILEKTCVKSFGDWFQEVNGVVEDGGYILDNSYRSSNNVLSHKNKNPLRLVVSNDRPSAVRIFHMLTFAKSGINPNAYGGFLPGKLNNAIILRKSNEKIRESRKSEKIINPSYSEQYKNKMKRLRSSSGLYSSLQPRRKKGGNKKIKKTRKINGGRTNRKTRKK